MFNEVIDDFFEEVNKRYTEIQKNDPLLFGKAAYIFQTGAPIFQPNLMVIGFNPGGNYAGDKIRLTNGDLNRYLYGDGWFATLRSIIPSEYLEHCVGTNKYYINTPQDKYIKNKDLQKLGTELSRKLIQIIQPRHIVCLHSDTFNTIKNSTIYKPYPEICFRLSKRDDTPVAYIPNPSPRNSRLYEEKLHIYSDAVTKFLNE